ncbi:DUF4352 domain-containing protein [Candidatus Peregrinibacteria bacterium]|nr:DUF4352 domain-containing protein [Candidatus Peregrinibacteria bacterium]
MADQKISEQEKFFKDKNRWSKIKGIGCLAFIVLVIISIATSQNKPNIAEKVDTVASTDTSTSSTSPDTKVAENKPVDKPASTIFKIGDVVKMNSTQLTVKEIGDCTTFKLRKPEAGKKVVYLDITSENIGNDSSPYNIYDFKLQDNQGFTYNSPSPFSTCKEPDYGSGNLQPGEKTRGFIHYEITAENKPAKLIYTPNLLSSDQIIITLN